jgi:hypothetical protein
MCQRETYRRPSYRLLRCAGEVFDPLSSFWMRPIFEAVTAGIVEVGDWIIRERSEVRPPAATRLSRSNPDE